MGMIRRDVLAAGAAVGLASGLRAAPARRPNILFILADDLGYADLGCYGSRHIRTPVLDRLAADGVWMGDAYASSCVCSPTRLALATGRYHQRFVTGLVEPFSAGPWGDQAIPKGQPTLPGLMKAAGYRTSLIGKWHLGESTGASPLAHGYDEFFGFLGGGIDYFTHEYLGRAALRSGNAPASRDGYMTDLLADETIAAIRRFGADRSRPFMLSLHFNAPHWPWEGPEDRALGTQGAHYDGGNLETYSRMVEAMDAQIGRVLAALKATGQDRDTIVVFTSDNGGERFSEMWPFRGHKGSLLEGGIRVPAIVRWPAALPRGARVATPAITLDWLPTFLDAAGIPVEGRPPLDGISLLPALKGQAMADRPLFWRFQGHNQRAVRHGRWKMYRLGDAPFLFDLGTDTMERANRAKAEPERMAMMTALFDRWNAEMAQDPIPGYCDRASTLAEPVDTGPASNCKPPRSAE